MSLGEGLIALLFLVLLSAFFSGSETAITSMDKARLGYLIKSHPRKRRALKLLLDDPNSLITAIVIANNFVNIFASSVATILSLRLLRLYLSEAEAGLVATILMTIYLLIFGEITPKNIAKSNAERITLTVIQPLWLLTRALRPLIAFFRGVSASLTKLLPRTYQGQEQLQVSEDQIKYLIEVGKERGLLDEKEAEMIKRIFAYDDMVAEQVMVPRPDVVMIEVNTPLEEVKRLVAEDGHSRFPVYEKIPDNVVGILYAKDLLRADEGKPLRELIRPAFYTSTTRPINQLLRDFQRERQHMAIVMDEFGGMAGIITLEDILEEIVGEIADEYDKLKQPIKQISPNEYLVDGDAEIDLLNEELGLDLPLDEGVTISGLLLHRFEDIPDEGDSIKIDGVLITVEDASEREILKVRLAILPENQEEGEGEGEGTETTEVEA